MMPEPKQPITEDSSPVSMREGTDVNMSMILPPLPAPPLTLHPDGEYLTAPVQSPVRAAPIDPTPDTSFAGAAASITYSPLDMSEAEVGDPAYEDNVEAAMHEVAEGMDLTVSAMAKEDDAPADKQVLIRATEHDRERWKRAAEVVGLSLSALVREVMNTKATDILDCSHPPEYRKQYPWAQFCTKCDMRLTG